MVHTVHTAEENIKYIEISISIPRWHGCEKTAKYLQKLQINFGMLDATTIYRIWAWPNVCPLSWCCFVLIGLRDVGGGRGWGCDAVWCVTVTLALELITWHSVTRYTGAAAAPLFTLYTANEPHMETTLSGVLYNVLLIFWSTDISRYHCRL